MSGTMHEHLAETMLDQILEDPDGAETLALAHAGLRDARWGQDFIEAIGQDARRHAARLLLGGAEPLPKDDGPDAGR